MINSVNQQTLKMNKEERKRKIELNQPEKNYGNQKICHNNNSNYK
jgi:hypothetical protein